MTLASWLLAFLGLARRPSLLDDLGRPPHRQGAGRHILRDRRARADVGALADGDRRHQARVGPDEGAVVDLRLVLGDSIIVAGDRPGADVDIFADRGIADVRAMRHPRPPPDPRLLPLAECAEPRL